MFTNIAVNLYFSKINLLGYAKFISCGLGDFKNTTLVDFKFIKLTRGKHAASRVDFLSISACSKRQKESKTDKYEAMSQNIQINNMIIATNITTGRLNIVHPNRFKDKLIEKPSDQ